MSRGLGAIQRIALRILRDGRWHTTTDLAAQIYGYMPCITVTGTPTRSQMASALRALSGLVEAGLAYCVPGKPSRWTANRDRHVADKLRRGHYLRSVPTRPVMFFEYGGAVVCFAVPGSRNIARWLIGKPNSVLELARLWSPDDHAPSLLTKALSAAIKKLRRDHPQCEAIVSYADPNAGHNGTVYRAASWVDLGPITETRYCRDAAGKPVSRRTFNGRIVCRKADSQGAGYTTEENAQLKRRFARGLTRSARRQIAAKASHINS